MGFGLFAVFQDVFGLMAYTIIIGITAPFLFIWLSTVYFTALDDFKENWKDKYHLLIERDIALGVSRIISYIGVYLFIYFGDQVKLAKTWLLFLPVLPLILGLLLYLFERAVKNRYSTVANGVSKINV